jgi:hypothetical protein
LVLIVGCGASVAISRGSVWFIISNCNILGRVICTPLLWFRGSFFLVFPLFEKELHKRCTPICIYAASK